MELVRRSYLSQLAQVVELFPAITKPTWSDSVHIVE